MDAGTKKFFVGLMETVQLLIDEAEPLEMSEDPDEYILSSETIRDLQQHYLACRRELGLEPEHTEHTE